MEEVTEKHLKAIIEELSDKNIIGVKFVKQGSKVILLIDKTLLSRTNQQIVDAINVVYPNIIISINDSKNPFDYEGVYEQDSEKANKKVRPCVLASYSYGKEKPDVKDYFSKFRYTGIELDTNEIPVKNIQFGYFLEFINALQEQDVIQYESLEVLDEDTVCKHEHYLKNRCPDKKHIELWVHYNEELSEYSNGLKISEDPYLSKLYISVLNKGASSVNEQHVKLTLERINQNVQNYLRKKCQEDAENPREIYLENQDINIQPRLQDGMEIE